jgi:hypothetical protein
LSPGKGDPRSRPDASKSKILDALDRLVERMIAIAPERGDKILDYADRLRGAFLGPDAHAQTKLAQKARKESLILDDVFLTGSAMEFLDKPEVGGDILAHGLAGKIHSALKKRREKGEAVPTWSVRTIRRKLKRNAEKLEKEMPADMTLRLPATRNEKR